MHAHLLSFSPIDREEATVSKQMREESLPSRNPTTAPEVTCTERFIFTIQLVNIVQQVPITKAAVFHYINLICVVFVSFKS
jgi:hypothetical protein